MSNPVAVIIFVGWAIFWIGWVVAALGAKSGTTRWRRYAGFRVLVLVLVIVTLRSPILATRMEIHSPVAKGVGLALWVAGMALAVWARVYIGRNWGTPMSQKDDPELVTSGPYRHVRHPIYTGLILSLAGTAVAISLYWLVVVVLAGAYFVYSAHTEELFMTEQFPDAYPAYKRSTKMLIPFVF